jgi:putative transposase
MVPATAALIIVGLLKVRLRRRPAMAGVDRMTIEEVVRMVLVEDHADVIRGSVRWVAQQMMEFEVSELVGAELGERRLEDRATHRNGYRPRRWDTRAGEIELQIPKLRQGSYFPSFLQPRKRSEQALVAVVQQAYVCGVSTRRVDQLLESLGLRVSRSEVSRICAGLDEQVQAFRERPLEGRHPYLFLDGKVEKVRQGGRVVRKCVVIAHAGPRDWPAGDHRPGRRRGRDGGVLASVPALAGQARPGRGATGHLRCPPGLKAALAQVLGCPWQRCTVHFLRDCLGHARKDQHGLLAALIRPVFRAENGAEARQRLSEAVSQLERPLPKLAAMLAIEANDEWLVGKGYIARHTMEALLEERLHREDRPEELLELQAAREAHPPPDEKSDLLLHHYLGLDSASSCRKR